MFQDQEPKSWHPARFTHGGIRGSGDEIISPSVTGQHGVIILNNPLKNKDLLADVCMGGIHHTRARGFQFIADVIPQRVALYVLMAEQMNSMICTSLEKKKPTVSVVQFFATCYSVDPYFSSLMPYAEIWTP